MPETTNILSLILQLYSFYVYGCLVPIYVCTDLPRRGCWIPWDQLQMVGSRGAGAGN